MQHTPTHCHCGADREGSDHCPECGCEEYETVCDYVAVTVTRYAVVRSARSRSEAEAYLPRHYAVIGEAVEEEPRLGPRSPRFSRTVYVIAGRDSAGWTLDDYVIPRYASGLIQCEEIDLSHPIMKRIEVTS